MMCEISYVGPVSVSTTQTCTLPAVAARIVTLTLRKPYGHRVTGFCPRVFPFLRSFQSHDAAPDTDLRFNFYSGQRWYNSSAMPLYPRISTDEVAWRARLFRCLASTIIVQLDALEGQLQPRGPTALVVLAVFYVGR